MDQQSQISDSELWLSFLAGDDYALEKIYRKYYRDLLAYGCKMFQDKDVVKDCIQDLFIKIHTHRQNLSPTLSLRPYLTLSLKRTIYNVLRDEREIYDIENLPFNLASESDIIENLFPNNDEQMERRKKLIIAVGMLSARQKEAIYLRFIQELDFYEIGETLEINYQSARNLIFRTLVKLRNFYLSL